MIQIVLENTPDESTGGDCYRVAYKTFFNDPDKYKLVHGIVTGQGDLEGVEYNHAWVLDGDKVIDNTLPLQYHNLPKEVYYALGKVKITREYDFDQVIKNSNKYGTYGPWDKELWKYP